MLLLGRGQDQLTLIVYQHHPNSRTCSSTGLFDALCRIQQTTTISTAPLSIAWSLGLIRRLHQLSSSESLRQKACSLLLSLERNVLKDRVALDERLLKNQTYFISTRWRHPPKSRPVGPARDVLCGGHQRAGSNTVFRVWCILCRHVNTAAA